MKKLFIYSICLITILIFSSASFAEESIVVATAANIRSLDPHHGTDNNSISAHRLIMETLIKFDKNFKKFVPLLATSWNISDDGTMYTFKLREGVKFHDGTPFNAKAVKISIDRVRTKKNKLRRYGFFKMIKETEVIDEYTVALILSYPFGGMLNNLAGPGGPIHSPAALAKYGKKVSRHPVGTGPFKFVEWVTGDHLTLIKNENYWRKGFPKVDKITFRPIAESGSRVAMLKTGEADFIYPFPIEHYKSVASNKNIKVDFLEGLTIDFITLNMLHKPFDDVRVRQAVNLAVDKRAYLEISVGGHGRVPDSIMAPGVQFYAKQRPWTFNLEKAKKLLKEAGYSKGFDVELWSNTRADRLEMQEFIQQQLAQVGIRVKVVPMEGGILNQRSRQVKDWRKAEVRMRIAGWSPSNYDADWAIRPLLGVDAWPPNGGNTAYYDNKKVEELLLAGLKTSNPEEREKIYSEIQSIIWNDVPWLLLSNKDKISAKQANIHNAIMHPDGTFNLIDVYRN